MKDFKKAKIAESYTAVLRKNGIAKNKILHSLKWKFVLVGVNFFSFFLLFMSLFDSASNKWNST